MRPKLKYPTGVMQTVQQLPKTGDMLRRIEEKAARSSDYKVSEAMGVLTAVLMKWAEPKLLPSGARVGDVVVWIDNKGRRQRGFIVMEDIMGVGTIKEPHYLILFDPEAPNTPETLLTLQLPAAGVLVEGQTKTLEEIAPTRFLLSAEGDAINYRRWKERGAHPEPTNVWVRNDGWTLAAQVDLTMYARNLWHNEWVGVWNYVGPDSYAYHDLTGDNALAPLSELG